MGLLPKNHLRKRGLFDYLISAAALAKNVRAIRHIDDRETFGGVYGGVERSCNSCSPASPTIHGRHTMRTCRASTELAALHPSAGTPTLSSPNGMPTRQRVPVKGGCVLGARPTVPFPVRPSRKRGPGTSP